VSWFRVLWYKHTENYEIMLNTIEKVLLLQEVDIFESIATEQLSKIALITKIVEYRKGDVIYHLNDATTGMYVVIEGQVQLHQKNEKITTAKAKTAFGVWALFDEEKRAMTATCEEDTQLLWLRKQDFYDLLTDYSEITQNILKTMAHRLRSIADRVKLSDPGKK